MNFARTYHKHAGLTPRAAAWLAILLIGGVICSSGIAGKDSDRSNLMPTVTPNAEIYMFEDALEKGVAAHLLANGINDPKKQRDTDKNGLLTPRVEVKAIFNGWGPNAHAPHYWQGGDTYGGKWPDAQTGRLFVKVVTRRNDADQNHARLRGTVRSVLQSCSAINGRMDWHSLEKLIENGTVPDFLQNQFHDVSAVSFDVTMRILFDTKAVQIFTISS